MKKRGEPKLDLMRILIYMKSLFSTISFILLFCIQFCLRSILMLNSSSNFFKTTRFASSMINPLNNPCLHFKQKKLLNRICIQRSIQPRFLSLILFRQPAQSSWNYILFSKLILKCTGYWQIFLSFATTDSS